MARTEALSRPPPADDIVEILQCPQTHGALRWVSERALAAEGGPSYPVVDGVACFLPAEVSADPRENIRDYYETGGWAVDDTGVFGDTKRFLDTRAASLAFTRHCITRLNKYFARGGRYLLDAGSGAIPHDELLTYDARFERRVCVDLSKPALTAARAKIGERGIYLQGDLTNLPLKTGSMDAITCNHVIYQIPADQQAAAFRELWRVLKPGGVAVVVYLWPYAPLARRIEQLARLFVGDRTPRAAQHSALEQPDLYHHPHPRSWFEAQDWPFRYEFDAFRVVGNAFMRDYVSDDWRGRAFLDALFALQQGAPAFCGKYGAIPTIVIHKD